MYKVILHILLAVVAAFMFQSCSNDTDLDTGQGNNKQKVTISLVQSTQDRTGASLRSMSVTQENEINEIDILAFRKTGGIYKLAYSVKGIDIQQQNPQYEFSTFTAWLETGEQKFVFIANASSYIHNLGIQIGDKFDDIISNLTVDSNSEWLNLYIPMYGEIDTEITNTSTTLSNIYLIRMLARFDISLQSTVTNFDFKEAYIFNRKQSGRIAYDLPNWDNISGKVITATMPLSVLTEKLPNYKYEATANKIKQSIYTFESKGVNIRSNATAIVVGGIFDTDSDVSYYRIDIPPTLPNFVSGDILRNHLYNITIAKVSKKGAVTPEEAFDGNYSLEAEVEDWVNAENNIVLDPQYYLYVDSSHILLSEIGTGFKITASTDHPEGITVQSQTAGVTVSGGSNGDQYRILTVKSNTSGSFTLKAGNLSLVVRIF